jgi:hypothetical protein
MDCEIVRVGAPWFRGDEEADLAFEIEATFYKCHRSLWVHLSLSILALGAGLVLALNPHAFKWPVLVDSELVRLVGVLVMAVGA